MERSHIAGTYTTVPTLRAELGPWTPSRGVQDAALFGSMSYTHNLVTSDSQLEV